MAPAALLFDLDGVIVASEQHWVSTEADFLSGLIPEWSEVNQRRLLGLSVRDVFRLLVSEFGLQTRWDKFLEFYDKRAIPIYSELAAEVPGATGLMRAASAAGIPIGIVSNSPQRWIRMVVDRFKLAPLLTCTVSSEDVSTPGKPDPGVYLHALKLIGAAPGQTFAVEDSRKGIESVKAAGITCVGLLNGYNSRNHLAAADVVVDGFQDSWWEKITQS